MTCKQAITDIFACGKEWYVLQLLECVLCAANCVRANIHRPKDWSNESNAQDEAISNQLAQYIEYFFDHDF